MRVPTWLRLKSVLEGCGPGAVPVQGIGFSEQPRAAAPCETRQQCLPENGREGAGSAGHTNKWIYFR